MTRLSAPSQNIPPPNPSITHTNQYLSQEGEGSQNNKFIPLFSIMVSCIGTVGIVSINNQIVQTNQQINTIIPNNPKSNYFLFYSLQQLKPRMEAMGGGVTMPNINKSKFESFKIIYPKNSLLNIYFHFADMIYKQIENLIKEKMELVKARDLLLPKMMNSSLVT